MRKITKRSAAIATAAVLGVGGAGGAAAWAAGWFKGHGSVTANTASIHDLQATVNLADKLYPGKTTSASASVTNTNDYPVKLTGLANPVLTQTGGAGCTIQNSKITPSLPTTKPVLNSGETVTVVFPVSMGLDADESCAGSTLKVDFDLQGEVTTAHA
jgi:hypothetical protein